jgi:hypothetical protein
MQVITSRMSASYHKWGNSLLSGRNKKYRDSQGFEEGKVRDKG